MRSNRHRRVSPPSRPHTPCSEAIRYGCSSEQASTPRHFPDADSAPVSRCAVLPHPHHAGGSGSSTQSHWVSSPGGCSIIANSAGVAAANSAVANRCGSSANRIRQYSANRSNRSGPAGFRLPGSRCPAR